MAIIFLISVNIEWTKNISSFYIWIEFTQWKDRFDESERMLFMFLNLDTSAVCCPYSPDRFSCLIHVKNLCSCKNTYSSDVLWMNLNSLVQALEGDYSAIQKCAIEIFEIDSLSNHGSSDNQQCDISMAKSEPLVNKDAVLCMAKSEPLIKKDAMDATESYDGKLSVCLVILWKHRLLSSLVQNYLVLSWMIPRSIHIS